MIALFEVAVYTSRPARQGFALFVDQPDPNRTRYVSFRGCQSTYSPLISWINLRSEKANSIYGGDMWRGGGATDRARAER